LGGLPGIQPPRVREGSEHVFHQYTIRAENRDSLLEKLTQKGIGSGVYYPIPIHQQPLYKELGFDVDLPVAEAASLHVLSIPVHPGLNQANLDEIVASLTCL